MADLGYVTVFGINMAVWDVLSWFFAGVGLIGTCMNAERNKYGFIFWMFSNAYMVIRFLVIGEYAQMVLFFAYFVMAVRGIYSWIKKENQEKIK